MLAKPYLVLKALLRSKLAGNKSANTFINNFSGARGSLFGVEVVGHPAEASAQLEAVVAELKAIAAQCPDIEVVKNKVWFVY